MNINEGIKEIKEKIIQENKKKLKLNENNIKINNINKNYDNNFLHISNSRTSRGNKIRSYNWQTNQLTDHRNGLKESLNKFLKGDLDFLLNQ